MQHTSSRTSHSTPVVIFGAPNHGALGIARSLGRLGAPVYVIDGKPRNPTRFSRYCRRHHTFGAANARPEAVVAFLLGIARELGRRAVLIPTTDAGALLAADHAAELSEWYLLPGQKPETAHRLADKYSMAQTATRFGIPTPAVFRPQSRADVLNFCESAAFPVVMKPTGSGAKTIHIVRTAEELISRFDETACLEDANFLLQEYIPGDEKTIWMFNGYFNADSECLFGATGQKVRQSPVYTGASCLAVCRANSVVYETTVAFMKAVGYRGILDIGYRYDARDGKYKVLDVNPRIGCTFRLFASDSGMDVARALYLDLTGQPVQPAQVSEGRKWMVEDCDIVSSIRYINDGVLSLPDWFRSFKGVRETAFLSVTDPLPAVAVAARDLREVASRVRSLFRRAGVRRGSRENAGLRSDRLSPVPKTDRP